MSLVLALIIVVLINILYTTLINNRLTTAYILLVDTNKGTMLLEDNILEVKLTANKKDISSVAEYATLEQVTSMYTGCNMEKGTLIKFSNLSMEQGLLEDVDYEYIAIPFEESEDTVAYHNVSKGSLVNLYFSARTEDVNNILNLIPDKMKVYSSLDKDAIVTVNLYNKIEVIETLDTNGKKVNGGKISQIIFKVPKEDSALITNIKVYRDFFINVN